MTAAPPLAGRIPRSFQPSWPEQCHLMSGLSNDRARLWPARTGRGGVAWPAGQHRFGAAVRCGAAQQLRPLGEPWIAGPMAAVQINCSRARRATQSARSRKPDNAQLDVITPSTGSGRSFKDQIYAEA